MDLTVIANLAQALAVVFAVIFGYVQVRQLKAQRRRESMFSLVQSLQTTEMLQALLVLDDIPEGLSESKLKRRLGAKFIDIQLLLGTWESLGILVYYDEVSLAIVDEFYSGSIVHSWRKLQQLVEDIRKRTARDTRWEWFQWLSERMLEREAGSPPIPAFLAHQNWKTP